MWDTTTLYISKTTSTSTSLTLCSNGNLPPLEKARKGEKKGPAFFTKRRRKGRQKVEKRRPFCKAIGHRPPKYPANHKVSLFLLHPVRTQRHFTRHFNSFPHFDAHHRHHIFKLLSLTLPPPTPPALYRIHPKMNPPQPQSINPTNSFDETSAVRDLSNAPAAANDSLTDPPTEPCPPKKSKRSQSFFTSNPLTTPMPH
jgi:hypothetical protein